MSSPKIRHALLCAIFLGSSYAFAASGQNRCDQQNSGAGEAQKCLRQICHAKEKCSKARTGADSSTAQNAGRATEAARQGRANMRRGAGTNAGVSAGANQAYSGARKTCDEQKPKCKAECNLSSITDQAQKTRVQDEQRSCESDIQGNISDLDKAINETGRQASGSNQTGEKAQGQGQNNQGQQQQGQQQQGQQQSPQSPQQPEQQQQQQPQSQQQPQQQSQNPNAQTNLQSQSDPCQGANANLYSQCKGVVADRCRSQSPGAVGFGTPDPSCSTSGARPASSATCARFEQQCGKDSQNCLKTMSAADRAKIQSECMNSSPAQAEQRGQAGFGVASVTSSHGGGGGGGAGSFGSSSGPSLEDLSAFKQLADGAVHRERDPFGDMRVDSGGGYSSSAGDGGGNASGSDSGHYGMSSASSQGQGARGPASATGRSPSSANATDVDNRFGPSVFSIQSSVLQSRCSRGQLLHCVPKVK